MTTFVLVHGAWAGSFCFRHVRRRLQREGHEVFTPSLTGVGERVHLVSPDVDLTTHVRDVVNQILYEDLTEIVLLGYSYGGAVVTGCLKHVAERVSHLVYLDAFVPSDGQSIADIVGAPEPPISLGVEALVPPLLREFDDPAEAEFVAARRVPQPVGTLFEPVKLTQALEAFPLSRTYIRATGAGPDEPGNAHFAVAAAHARASDEWSCHDIDTNHMVLSNRPDELADVLLNIV
ncbi:MAG: alpha/beta fold hydrolase [Myxococcales bacterium]|nr:alpha/beta fold hydrolase [Myxococcales bacterium]